MGILWEILNDNNLDRTLLWLDIAGHPLQIKIKLYLEKVFRLWNKLNEYQQNKFKNSVDLPAKHPEDNGIIIPLWKRKLKSKTEASILSLHVSTVRLCYRIKDFQSRIEITVYIILTTASLSAQLKAENCCGFKCFFVHVGKTWRDSSCFVQQNVFKKMFELSLMAKTGATLTVVD